MNTALSWIKAYVPELECTDQEYMDAMTLSGTKCEGFERLDADLDKIVVGQIEKIESEQNANDEAYDRDVERIVNLTENGAISEEEAELRKDRKYL